MIKINKLDSSIYNRISAGEVVERPASVVKELLENSIDAGASIISLSISGGGIRNITVTDNGSGIASECIADAFLPHATSKISSINDLDDISTLGFRGEALASIASVSIIEMTSKAFDEELGVKICLSGGNITSKEQWGGNSGTTISVSELFFNTPARAKFLKSARSEQAEISEVVRELILANPNVSITYCADGVVIYESVGQGLIEALYNVCSKDLCDKLLPVKKSVGNYEVFGYLGNPQLTKSNRNYQTVIVNGRTVKNQTIGIAVAQAFGNRLMTRSFPVFVLNILMPFDDLDVNVHPSKTEVRFKDQKTIFSLIFSAVRETLEVYEGAFKAEEQNLQKSDEIQRSSETFASENIKAAANYKMEEGISSSLNSLNDAAASLMPSFDFNALKKSQNEQFASQNEGKEQYNYKNDAKLEQFYEIDNQQPIKTNDRFKNVNGYTRQIKSSMLEFDLDSIKILGQVFLTYILLDDGKFLYVIDQHAAQERMFYDKLVAENKNNCIQKQFLLLPVVEHLTSKEFEYIMENRDVFSEFGFDIDEFGDNTVKITTVPAMFAGKNLKSLFSDFLSERNSYGNLEFNAIKEKFAQVACKAAIKSGDKLSIDDIKALLKAMNAGMPLQCPHGRPAIIKLDKRDFDKLFKRIL